MSEHATRLRCRHLVTAAHGVLDGAVLVIADEVDENLYLASRNLKNVFVVEPRYADPVSLVHYKKVLVTKGAIDKLKEMFA